MMISRNLFGLRYLRSSLFPVLFATLFIASCGEQKSTIALKGQTSPYLLLFAGDHDTKDSDFIAVLDVDPKSDAISAPLTSIETGQQNSMPHHMEYVAPPAGEPIFMNGHRHEASMIVDVADLPNITIRKSFTPPSPFRFPHDYTRTPGGTRLVGFLRSDGASPDADEKTSPGYHGGIAEYNQGGEVIRSVSAAVPGAQKAVRPYAFALLPEIDRFVVTSAPMMETSWADVIQVYRYSDFELLHTIELPVGVLANGEEVPGSQAAGFGPRILGDGTVFLNSYGCAFYHLSQIDSDAPSLKLVHTIATAPTNNPGKIRGACGIPFRVGHYWVQPVGHKNSVVVLDIKDPLNPREVFHLSTPKDFKPHWLAKDPRANRLILGSELGGEQGFYVLRIDEKTGALDFDDHFQARRKKGLFKSKSMGYISLERDEWPHGKTGHAWGHAALFLNHQ